MQTLYLPGDLCADPMMTASGGAEAESGQRAGKGRLSWPVLLLMLAAVTSSSISALSMYQLVALRAEVEGLKLDVYRRREEGQEPKHGDQAAEHISVYRRSQEPLQPKQRTRRFVSAPEKLISQPCLQFLANSSRETFRKEFKSEPYTGIPWQAGLRRGSALEPDGDTMLVREEGYYFVYSQVYYIDSTFAMGHVLIRKKINVVGDEPEYVVLFRCIQNMNPVHPYNTCYTGGIVKLEIGDQLELLIPRSTANVSLDGGSTFLGAIKLA
ncbi:tumor necrosis factor ligand superfamily member 13B [Genypterus blacodes]|uniref:tumor necrosis factor ligand superfamily member 13B n=1 Tax=Genypterus blacodes TaxID=154954 RepID=UPI003F75DADC